MTDTATLCFSHSLSSDEVLEVLRSFLTTPAYTAPGADTVWGIPFAVWGEPGTAKSSITREIGSKLFGLSLTMSLAQHDAEEIAGYGVPNKTRTAMTKLPSPVFAEANAAASACIGLDEFGSVAEHKQAAALTLLTERLAGDTKVAGHVRIFAIGNPPECAADANTLAAPTANRFLHVPWVAPSVGSMKAHWRRASLSREIVREDVAEIEARVLAAWPEAYSAAVTIVGEYLDRFEADAHAMSDGDDYRWPSVRSWTNLIHALAGGIIHGRSHGPRELRAHGAIRQDPRGARGDGDIPRQLHGRRSGGSRPCVVDSRGPGDREPLRRSGFRPRVRPGDVSKRREGRAGVRPR